jgi:adenylyl-sulfate kinase
MNQLGLTVWLTGLSGAGKSTIAARVAAHLREQGRCVMVLDGDVIRKTLSRDLGFSREDRDTNVRRMGSIAEMLTRSGVVVIVAAIAPYRTARDDVRAQIGRFLEVYVHCPVEELVRRDVRGLYRRALAGELANFTGISDPYEEPVMPDVRVDTSIEVVDESVERVLSAIHLAMPSGDRLPAPSNLGHGRL